MDAANFDAQSVATYKRPDAAATLKRAHDAAAYDKWFRSEVDATSRGEFNANPDHR